MEISLKKGEGSLNFDLPEGKIINILEGPDVDVLDHDKIHEIIKNGIIDSSPDNIDRKKIAVIIPDDTRLWARGDLFIPTIIKTLESLSVPLEKIRIIIALGTHRDIPSEKFSELAGTYSAHRIEILNSAGLHPERLVKIGSTPAGTPLLVTKEAWEADHIIIFGGVLHHMLAGFGGDENISSLVFQGEKSIRHNHSLAIVADGKPHPLVRQEILSGNPVSEDMQAGADIFLHDKTSCYICVAVNGRGEIFHADAGEMNHTFHRGCEALNLACCVDVETKGDFALFSAGGHRTDGQLYQATKALFNAVNVVKEGGDLLFTAECSSGVGNQGFAEALKNFRDSPEKLGKVLTEEFDMPSYVALRVMDLIKRFKITLVSGFDESLTRSMGFMYCRDIETYINNLSGKGYVIPFAENILPRVKYRIGK